MKTNALFNKPAMIGVLCAIIILVSATSSLSGLRERWAERKEKGQSANSACDDILPGINEGYGAEGPYDMDVKTISNPLWKGEQISVFFPKGASGQRPVIFFSHGFGGTDWKYVYAPFMKHMVSRGNIVVFSPYQTLRADSDERYATLRKGFELAVQNYGQQMDLSRVGFAGHSFGGGATPSMAYDGLVNKGWGKKGAFLFILAPWYSFQINPDELKKFPGHVVLIMQVYDKDDMNDHRMAIDIYRTIQLPASQKHFMVVRSKSIKGCELVADHATPSRNPSLPLKQHAIFRPFDAVSDYVFNGNLKGNDIILGTSLPSEKEGYQPLLIDADPKPLLSEKSYRFSWDNDKNPRRSLKSW